MVATDTAGDLTSTWCAATKHNTMLGAISHEQQQQLHSAADGAGNPCRDAVCVETWDACWQHIPPRLVSRTQASVTAPDARRSPPALTVPEASLISEFYTTMPTDVPESASDTIVPYGSAQQLADALAATLGPGDDLRHTRDTFTEDELDRVELSLLTVSRSLNGIRNAFAPVNTLPRETLAAIFHILASDAGPPSSSFLPEFATLSSPPAHAWTAVTHVCRYWRSTALAFPTLWTSIDTASPLFALTSLARAAHAPLRLHLRDAVLCSAVRPSLMSAPLLQSLAAHTAQLATLHVQPTFRYGTELLRAFDQPAPQLRALSVALALGASAERETGRDRTLPLLFAGETPALKQLTLCDFARWPCERWDAGRNLTHLCLYDQPTRSRLPMDEFVRLLAGCPRLEELVVIEAGPSASPAPLETSPVPPMLDMPHLRLLHLGNWASPRLVAQFLAHVSLPDTTTLEIWGDVLFHSADTLSALLPPALTHLRPLHAPRAVHLTYRPTLPSAPQLLSAAHGVLVVHFYYITSASAALLASVFAALDVRAVRELTVGVDCEPELPLGWWRGAFARMPALRRLSIIRRPSRAILAALTPEERDCPSTAAPEAPLLCPALSTLVITDDSALASIRLFALAQARATLGVPIQQLMIVSATPGLGCSDARMREEVEDLRCHVAEVRVAPLGDTDAQKVPVGWPSAPFLWAAQRKEAKGTRRIA